MIEIAQLRDQLNDLHRSLTALRELLLANDISDWDLLLSLRRIEILSDSCSKQLALIKLRHSSREFWCLHFVLNANLQSIGDIKNVIKQSKSVLYRSIQETMSLKKSDLWDIRTEALRWWSSSQRYEHKALDAMLQLLEE